jgi:hypothetical protein
MRNALTKNKNQLTIEQCENILKSPFLLLHTEKEQNKQNSFQSIIEKLIIMFANISFILFKNQTISIDSG